VGVMRNQQRRAAARRRVFLASAFVLALVASAAPAASEVVSGPPNALQGFSQNRDKPVQINAAMLEVHDKDKVATFSGNVRMVQGDTTLRCPTLVVFYEQDPAASAPTPDATVAQPGGQQQIKRIEAIGGVIVTQKDQTATGDKGLFDMKSNTVTLLGDVILSQGQNVAKAQRLVADLTTGTSRLECDNPNTCRVKTILQNTDAPAQRKVP
jgi:lipopolysaccharide export system protein LptA